MGINHSSYKSSFLDLSVYHLQTTLDCPCLSTVINSNQVCDKFYAVFSKHMSP